jgi:hypothetical protein
VLTIVRKGQQQALDIMRRARCKVRKRLRRVARRTRLDHRVILLNYSRRNLAAVGIIEDPTSAILTDRSQDVQAKKAPSVPDGTMQDINQH